MRGLGYAVPGIFAFGFVEMPLVHGIELPDLANLLPSFESVEERDRKRATKKAEAEAKVRAEEEAALKIAKGLLGDFFLNQKTDLHSKNQVSKADQDALLNFDINLDAAKAVLSKAIEKQIELVKQLITDLRVFSRLEKIVLNQLVDNVNSELKQNTDALQGNDNPEIFARAAIATISSLDLSIKAVKGEEGDNLSREGQLKVFCAVIGGLLGLIGGVGGPLGLALGVAAGITVGIFVGKAIARLTASPEEKLKNQCDEFRDPSLFSFMDKHSLHAGQCSRSSFWHGSKLSAEAENARRGQEYHATQSFVTPCF